jgi:exopolysaccharide production protein ExoQ
LVFIFLIPDYGLHSEEEHLGTWRGAFFHKNTTGRVMGFGLAVVVAAWIAKAVDRKILLAIGSMLFLIALGTTSQTTLLGILSFIPAIIAVRIMRGTVVKSALIGFLFLTVAWHGALIGFVIYESILELLGRDPSLTGRTDIWAYAIEHIMKQPLTGYGYEAFWNGEYSPGANYAVYWKTPHSHNSWIEVALAVGVPGALILLGITVTLLARTFVIARYYDDLAPATFIALVTFSMLTVGMSEPIFMEKHSLDWMLWVVVVGCARAMTSALGNVKTQQRELESSRLNTTPSFAGRPARMRPIL